MTRLRLPALLAGALLVSVLSSLPAAAHGEKPAAAHGGQVGDADGYWLELMTNGSELSVFVRDESGAAVPAAALIGTASVLLDGKPRKVELRPAGANQLTATLPAPAGDRLVATVSVKVGGRTVSARFTGA